jgi:hypothetical protein
MGQVVAELRSCQSSVSGKGAKPSAIAEASKCTEEEPKSVYKFVDSTESERSPRLRAASTVFVRSRGSNIEWVEGPRSKRTRRRQRLIAALALFALAAAGWYLGIRTGWFGPR